MGEHEELLQHDAFLRRLVRSLVSGDDQAEDLVQDTWVAALRGGGPRESRALTSWLARIARNLSIRKSERETTRRDLERARAFESSHASELSGDEVVERLALQRRVVEEVETLRESHRRAVFLRYFEGLSPEQIALRLEIPVGTVKTRLRRALTRLRTRLSDDGESGALFGLGVLLGGHGTTASSPVHATTLAGSVIGTKGILAASAVVFGAGLWFALGQIPSGERDLDGSTLARSKAARLVESGLPPLRPTDSPGAPRTGSNRDNQGEGASTLVRVLDLDGESIAEPTDGREDSNDKALDATAPQQHEQVDQPANDNEAKSTDITKPSARTAVGRVVDDRGSPLASGHVNAVLETFSNTSARRLNDLPHFEFGKPLSSSASSERGKNTTQVNAGTYRFAGLEAGEWRLTALGKGDTRSESVPCTWPTSTELPTLVVPRAAIVEGLVESVDGRRLVGANVLVWYAGEPNALHEANVAMGLDAPEPRSTTDESGHFRLDGLIPGSLRVCATHRDYANGEWTRVTVAAGEESGGHRLVLDPGGRVEGFVDPSVGETAGRTIHLYSFRGTIGWRRTVTDADGSFALEHVIPQRYIVELKPVGNPPSINGVVAPSVRIEIDVAAGETTSVTFKNEAPIRVYGTVACGGAPLEGARVTATPRGSVPDRQDECNTSGSGAFELEVSGPGEFWLTFRANQGSYAYVELTVPEAERFERNVELPAGRITGVVRSPDGETLTRIPVSLKTLQGDLPDELAWRANREMYTDSEGAFDFRFLEPGPYILRSPDGSWRSSPPPVTPFGRVVVSDLEIGASGTTRNVTLRLEPEGRITGIALDERGQPVPSAWVHVRDSLDRSISADWETQADARGQFEIPSVSRGTYTVVVSDGELRGSTPGVQVDAGKTTPTTVLLIPTE